MAKCKQRKQRHPFLILIGIFLILASAFLFSHQESFSFSQISQETFSKNANQQLDDEGFKTPLLLQTDERWKDLAYGTGEENDIAHNGCALLSLSMVLSHWRQTTIDPQEIFSWAQNRYFVEGAGTAWSIFPDFANQYQLTYHDLGNDFQKAQSYLEQDIPVIASVTAGDFTDGGHILVLARMTGTEIRVLDPNDDPEKNHFKQNFSTEEIQNQAIHYWTFTN